MAENSQICFDLPSGERLPYDLPITEEELSIAINKNLRNVSPGPDNIHAVMQNSIKTRPLISFFYSTPSFLKTTTSFAGILSSFFPS